MKHSLTLAFLIFLSGIFTAKSVEIEVILEKNEIKYNETFKITFKADFRADSLLKYEPKALKVINGPIAMSGSSNINGEVKSYSSVTFELRPIQTGTFEIQTPVFINNNEQFTGNTFKITILDEFLSKDETFKKDFDNFINDLNKPNGTIRFVIHGDKGFIEKMENYSWAFVRKLSRKEIENFLKSGLD